ncbi:hypothetical protein CVT26_007035 [Gymnopilus dilepis]|uniref:Protein kinase domain-containing protein n=1 Tax=Gymnopilus dilepis TaxID=231916 RepID=A0A409VNE4_9AGAR|nr:hypothetical protein CVT26_007035 [Gymnopilus dilepis]
MQPSGRFPANSPRKGGDHVPIWPQTGLAKASRLAIAQELKGHLAFDDPSVFRRLKLDRVPNDVVDQCWESMRNNPTILSAKAKLEEIARAAAGKKEEVDLPPGDDDSPSTGSQSSTNKTADEVKMYGPLRAIFQFIEGFDSSQLGFESTLKNSFQSTDRVQLKSDGTTYGFPKSSPDFTLLDMMDGIDRDRSGSYAAMWRHQSAFCEVKPADNQGPKYVSANQTRGVKAVVSQAADYARLHLSARPFQLFSVCLFIFGSGFCVGIFDREGVIFSPIHGIWRDPKVFIRVVRAMTHHLSAQDLGRDSTVSMLSKKEQAEWIAQLKKFKMPFAASEDYPCFRIGGVPCFGSRDLITIGTPIWTSLSFLGRGSSVWIVGDRYTGLPFIMKNSWRKSNRISESEVYGAFKGFHPALAKFEIGGDVVLRPAYMSVRNLRGLAVSPSDIQQSPTDTILHRLLLSSFGRPIINWETYKELLQGIRDAVSALHAPEAKVSPTHVAHEYLWDQGVLHRDVSAGNVLLSQKFAQATGLSDPPTTGFLMDVEFAHFKEATYDKTTKTAIPPIRRPGGYMTERTERTRVDFGQTVLRGGVMTGTAHFMATLLLHAMDEGITNFEHQPYHDLESFVYVLAYGLFGGIFLAGPKPSMAGIPKERLDKAKSYFRESFGRFNIRDIFRDRSGVFPLHPARQLQGHLPAPVSTLLYQLRGRVADQQQDPPRDVLTHRWFIRELEATIAVL